MRISILLAFALAACTATDDVSPDATIAPDADRCAELKASLVPRPNLGECVVPRVSDLPRDCRRGPNIDTAICTELVQDSATGAIGVLGMCRLIPCLTTPTP